VTTCTKGKPAVHCNRKPQLEKVERGAQYRTFETRGC